jgi:hypothetical protein
MSGRTFKEQVVIRKHVNDYLKEYGMTSLRKISVYVENKIGESPAPTTIARLVREFGYDREIVKWQKIETREEWVKK